MAVARVKRWATSTPIWAPFRPQELEAAFLACVRLVQGINLSKEIELLSSGRAVPKHHPLNHLTPFLDEAGILRVGGRLQSSKLSFSQKHPPILPKDSHLSELVIRQAHERCLHGGSNLTYAYIMKKCWIINGRAKTRAFVRRCVTCLKTRAKPMNQQMTPLPSKRIVRDRLFARTGVDYAGPVQVKSSKGRRTKSSKGYLAIFICLCTKAVHIEVVEDFTTDTFLAALHRFANRRGQPKELWSDNATTFHGADRTLKAMFSEADLQWPKIVNDLATKGISWKFIPPAAPHFGGLWEAAVKSAKTHMKRMICNQLLTYEELTTLMTKIERAMNSRTRMKKSMVYDTGDWFEGSTIDSCSDGLESWCEQPLSG